MKKNNQPSTGMGKAETFTVKKPSDVTVKKKKILKIKSNKDLHYSRLESLLLPNMFMCPLQHQRPLGTGCFSIFFSYFGVWVGFFPSQNDVEISLLQISHHL